jgi:hypothetical protein
MTTIDLESLVLESGGHASREQGVCLLEAVAWFAGQDHTDHPPCVSPVLGAFGRSLNDLLPQATRQELRPLIPLLPGTADDLDEQRSYLALDWLIRTHMRAWLELAGLAGPAAALREFRPLRILGDARAIHPLVISARDQAAAAGAAARAAAWDAARAAAWDASRAAARDAARDAAWDAAGAAARARLQPTIDELQKSAIGLFAMMINPE